MNNDRSISQGAGVDAVLLAIFVTLKLTNQIDWAWLWVLTPLWAPIALGALIATLFLLALIIKVFRIVLTKNK
jgi:hypothetical protein